MRFFQITTAALAAEGGSSNKLQRCIDIATFSVADEGRSPSEWEARDRSDRDFFRRDLPYVVRSDDGRAVLHASYKGRTVTIAKQTSGWNLLSHPILRWEWKAITLPANADETVSDRNDTAAAVYVIWKEPFPFFVSGIKYSWSSTLPVGTTASKRLGYDRLYVAESGTAKLHQWSPVSVDVKRHYHEMFSDTPPPPWGIALMTDADRSSNGAEAYFGPFRACTH